MPRRPLRAPLRPLALAALAAVTAAAAVPAAAPAARPAVRPVVPDGAATQPAATWPVGTREHVDLWLHGFALLLDDTARVPIFRRGYRDSLQALRTRANVTTRLDAERDRLRQRLGANRALALGAQFVPLAFASWPELRDAARALALTDGDPRRARDQRTAAMVAYLARTFPTAADREWLRVFADALDDESARFHHRWWLDAQRDRAAALAAADSVWQQVARPALQRFLNNTQQRDGTLLLSLALGGEGRTVTGGGREGNLVAVGFPARAADAAEVAWVAAHEAVGALAGTVVQDHTTPAEQRAGVADARVSAAQVRGGLLLLQRTAPELAEGYARYYLRQTGETVRGSAIGALPSVFPLPSAILEALERQIDVTLGGI